MWTLLSLGELPSKALLQFLGLKGVKIDIYHKILLAAYICRRGSSARFPPLSQVRSLFLPETEHGLISQTAAGNQA